jgi:ribosomal protein S18 acetylase RimI-like enzyme
MRRVPSSPRFVASVGTIERREELKDIQTGFKRGGMPLKDGATLVARLMEGSDVKSATEVMTESFRGSPDERPRARVAKYLLDQLESNPDEVCLVGVDEASDEVVAIVTLSFSQAARGGADAGARGGAGSGARALPSPPDAPYLCNMAVRESARGRGVAKALLGACDELVVEMGGADIWLHVRQNDPVATQLYTGAGYRIEATEEKKAVMFFKQKGDGVVRMRKELVPGGANSIFV